MKKILESSRFLVLIPVAFSIFAAAAAYIWGGVITVKTVYHIFHSIGADESFEAKVELIAIMDTFLIATALLIFAVGMYELFVQELEFPEWLKIHDLHSLKAKLGSVIVLLLAVTFLEHLAKWENGWETFLFGLAITLVSGALIAFGHFGGKD